MIGPGPAELSSRWLANAPGVLGGERRRPLYDHLQHLQDLALDAGRPLRFEGVDDAAAQLDPFSPHPRRHFIHEGGESPALPSHLGVRPPPGGARLPRGSESMNA